jgi:hypothetical protein
MIGDVLTEPVIELEGQLTRDDVIRFQYFHTFRRIWLVAAAFLVLAFLVQACLVVEFLTDPGYRTIFSNVAPFEFMLLFWLVMLGVMPYRNAKKAFSSQRYFAAPISYNFTASTISNHGQDISGSIAWSVLKHLRETRNYFFLYQNQANAFIVPKRFFRNEAQLDTWRSLISASVDAKIVEKPGFVGRRI